MAQFIGFVTGNRQTASRLGTKSSGMEAIARGWNVGGRVTAEHTKSVGPNGVDYVSFWLTTGSNGNGHSVYLGSFRRIESGGFEPCSSMGSTAHPKVVKAWNAYLAALNGADNV